MTYLKLVFAEALQNSLRMAIWGDEEDSHIKLFT